jgi:hypothetical protein
MALIPPKKLRGFAWMKVHDPVRFAYISSEAGKKAQREGKGHRWREGEKDASEAAVEGGKARWRKAREKANKHQSRKVKGGG